MGRKKNGKMGERKRIGEEKRWDKEKRRERGNGDCDEGFRMRERQTACFYNISDFL
jgi:hypothetical protein